MKSGHTGNPPTLQHELERLRAEHKLLSRKVEEFDRHRYLNTREQMERKRLQKMKLALKDQIARLETRS